MNSFCDDCETFFRYSKRRNRAHDDIFKFSLNSCILSLDFDFCECREWCLVMWNLRVKFFLSFSRRRFFSKFVKRENHSKQFSKTIQSRCLWYCKKSRWSHCTDRNARSFSIWKTYWILRLILRQKRNWILRRNDEYDVVTKIFSTSISFDFLMLMF